MNKLTEQLEEAKNKGDETLVRHIIDQILYVTNPMMGRPDEKHLIMFGKPAAAQSYYVKPEGQREWDFKKQKMKPYKARRKLKLRKGFVPPPKDNKGEKRALLLAEFKKKD